MFQLYHLVGQNGTHYLVILLPSLCHRGLGVIWFVLPLAKQTQPVQGLILFLILAPGFVFPFHLQMHGDQW